MGIATDGDDAIAQIAPDSSLGAESSRITPIDTGSDRIDGGAIRGANLFHSFQQFNIGEGRSVYFANPSGIENILTRITGSTRSDILGTLGVLGNANLFLINPNGIVFGPNARLDVRGSFLASTASSFQFADGTEFSATNPQAPPLLTINVPIGLQFGTNPASIVNQSRIVDAEGTRTGLEVLSGKTLALVGGDLILEGGSVTAPEGRIELGSVGDNSFVSLTPTAQNFALGYQGTSTFKDIQLSQQARVTANSAGNSHIQVQGRRVTLSDGSVIGSFTVGATSGGTVTVNASEVVELMGVSADGQNSSGLATFTFAIGNAGDVTINTGRLIIRDGALVTSVNLLSDGSAGTIRVNARESVEVTGTSADGQKQSALVTGTAGGGNSGDVIINTGRLIIQDGATVGSGTVSDGNAGTVNVNASESVEVIGTSADRRNQSSLVTRTDGGGNAGNVTINTGRLIIQDGATVGTETVSDGNAGTVTVNASQLVELIGTSADGQKQSLLSAATGGTGNAGNMTIQTGRLIIRDGAGVVAGTSSDGDGGTLTVNASESVELIGTSADGENQSALASATAGSGNSGDVTIQTGRLIIRDGATVGTATASDGDAGTVTVNASQSVELIGTSADGQNQSTLGTATSGTGNAGNITIQTGRLIVRDGAVVGAGTLSNGDAGTVTVNASESVELIGTSADGENQSSLATATDGGGNAGNVTIQTGRLIVRDGAIVAASTSSDGDGGTVTVNAGESVELIGTSANGQKQSVLGAATDGGGNAGNVTIQTGRLIVRDGAIVAAGTSSDGDGGTVTVNAGESVELIGTSADGQKQSGLATATSGTGNAGNMTIQTGRLIVRDGATVAAGTLSDGDGGTVTVNASESVELIGTSTDGENQSALVTATNGTGNAGNVTIQTGRLIVRDGAGVVAGTSSDGDGGTVTLNASQSVELIGTSADGQQQSLLAAATNGTGNAGNVTIQTGRLMVRDGARVVAGTSSDGDGGTVTVNASQSVELIGTSANTLRPSSLAATTEEGTGDAGNVTINTGQLTVQDGAVIGAGTIASLGNGGTIAINARRVVIKDGGVVIVGTIASPGDAGTITINASESVELSGTSADGINNSLLSATTIDGGNAGNVTINTGQLIVRDRAEIGVESEDFQDRLTPEQLALFQRLGLTYLLTGSTELLNQVPGDPGSIDITAPSLRLDNGGSINASSATGRGGNIQVRSRNIQLRRQSQISAAGSANLPTTEGNIDIKTQTLVLLENSSIITDALDPQGGSNIAIAPQNDFGLAIFRSPDSIINARGQLTIEENIQPDPPNIPQVEVVDATNLIARRCASIEQGSSFTVTGRGGIPPSPTEPLNGETYLVDLVTLDTEEQGSRGAGEQVGRWAGGQGSRWAGGQVSRESNSSPNSSPRTEIVEATGWIMNDKGQVVLTVSTPNVTSYRPGLMPVDCHVR